MKTTQITDRFAKVYLLEFDEILMEKRIDASGWTAWKVNHQVKDFSGEVVGHGSLEISCPVKDHKHISDESMILALLNRGAEMIKDNILKESSIESVNYRTRTDPNCSIMRSYLHE